MDNKASMLTLVFIVLIVLLGAMLGADYGEESTLQSICEQSGYDGWKRIAKIDYCYAGTGDDMVVVPLLVTMSVAEE